MAEFPASGSRFRFDPLKSEKQSFVDIMSPGYIARSNVGVPPLYSQEQPSDKSYAIAVCLSAIFGVIGIQHFYLGRFVEATIDLTLFIATFYFFISGEIMLAVLVGAVDALHTFIVTIMLLTGTFRDGRGRLVLYPGQTLKTGDSI